MTNQWNAAEYDAKHAFVYEKAKGLVELLAPKPGERILDLGCGTGALTAEIATRGAEVMGVDRSEEMITQARRKFPALQFEVLDARELRVKLGQIAARNRTGTAGKANRVEEAREVAWLGFDAVFSNAVLHRGRGSDHRSSAGAEARRTVRSRVRRQGQHSKAGEWISRGVRGTGHAATRGSKSVVLPERGGICGIAREAWLGGAGGVAFRPAYGAGRG